MTGERSARLDGLLDGLQALADDARGARDRVHGLLGAILSVSSQLDLAQVLDRVVEAAAALVDARCAVLDVSGPDGRAPGRFRAAGPPPEEDDGTGPWTRVPLRVREGVSGTLRVAGRRDGKDFDAGDEAVLATLAVAAGVAIDNARLYEEARSRHQWLEAGAEVTRSLLSGTARSRVLELVARRARELSGAELADVVVPLPGGPDLSVELAQGGDAAARRGLVMPAEGTLPGAAGAAGTPVTGRMSGAEPPPYRGLGPAAAVPVGAATGTVQGVLLLVRGKDGPAFGAEETALLLGFADQVALAMELAEHRRDAEQLALLEDRDRIARDLHDLAVQRLFATGMTLQSIVRSVERPEAAERVLRAVDDLDETIKTIRSAIFGLRTCTEGGGRGLRARAARAVAQARHGLGFPPRLSMEGLLDTEVPAHIADQAVAVLSEALSNAVRHSRAHRVRVALGATDAQVVVSVTDDGVGIPAGGRRSGLRNLARRAEELGGTLELRTPPGGGAQVVWTVPLVPPGAFGGGEDRP
ncbi:sensor histidine kinase [Streptomyces luteireticuli]|uniref:sensor histidine kinase n=1 Tax=Streptomyces luteireticuli TaxID=173858 RepID=UPI003556E349